jgi:hypothetical protein
MIMKKVIVLLCYIIITLAAFSQPQRYQEDSVKVNALISDKLITLKSSGVTKFLYLFSDAGSLAILYKLDGKIKGERVYYKGDRRGKFRRLRISNEDKLNFSNCVDIVLPNTIVNLSNCNEIVHSFNRIVFVISANDHLFQGSFTTDCAGGLVNNNMLCLFSIYKSFILNYSGNRP